MMFKFKRKATSVILAGVIMLSNLAVSPLTASAAENLVNVKAGAYNASLVSDPATSSLSDTPGGFSNFGIDSADGKVWTDKTVDSKSDGTFDVTLSALGQQYVASISSLTQGSKVAADAVLILDVTGSMNAAISKKDAAMRYQAMVEAANSAMHTVMAANKANRVSVVAFSATGNRTNLLLPLGNYANVGKEDAFLTFKTGTTPTISAGDKTGLSDSAYTVKVTGGTNAQEGITYGGYQLWNAVEGKTRGEDEQKRHPFVLFLTDGATTYYNPTWNTNGPDGRQPSSGRLNSSSADADAYTVLTAAYQKDKITSEYRKFNQDDSINTIWFNVGVGVTESNEAHERAVLDPYWVSKGGAGTAASVKRIIENDKNGEFKAPEKYIYTDRDESAPEGEGYYITYAETEESVKNAFSALGSIISSLTSAVAPPVSSTTNDVKGGGAISFTDQLGEGMELRQEPAVTFDGKEYGLTGIEKDGDTVYSNTSLPGLKITANASGEIVWDIPGDLLPLFSFKNGKDSTQGYKEQSPIKVTYNIGLKQEALDADKSLPAYYYAAAHDGTNGAKVVFTPTKDNPYYYETNVMAGAVGKPQDIHMTEANAGNFYKGTLVNSFADGETLTDVFITSEMATIENAPFKISQVGTLQDIEVTADLSSNSELAAALKRTIKSCMTAGAGDAADTAAVYAFHTGILKQAFYAEAEKTKADNTTETADYYYKSSFDSNGVRTAYLGNNGKIILNTDADLLLMVDKEAATAGEEILYRIIVTNRTKDTMTNVVVKDPIPAGLESIQISTGFAGSNVDGNAVWILGELQPGASVVLMVRGTIPFGARDYDKYNNQAYMTINGGQPISSNKVLTTVAADAPTVEILAPETVAPADTYTYTVQINNSSLNTLHNVVVSTAVPDGLTADEDAILAGGGTLSQDGKSIEWTVDSLNANSVKNLTFDVIVPDDAAHNTTYKNQASVISVDGDSFVTMSPEITTTVVSEHIVNITLNKDAKEWTDTSVKLISKDGYTEIVLTGKDGVYTGSVPSGDYEVSVEGTNEDARTEISVGDADTDWHINYYTLTLVKEPGIKSVPEGAVYLEGAEITIAGAEVVDAVGYHFAEWISDVEDVLNDGTKREQTFQMPNQSLILTAKAEANKVNAIFDAADGAFAGDILSKPIEQTYNSKFILPQEEPKRQGYTFEGWYTEATGGSQIDTETTVAITTDTTYYAQWKLRGDVTYNYEPNDSKMGTVDPGQETGNQEVGNFEGSMATANEADGYHFVKWIVKGDTEAKSVCDTPKFVPASKDGLYEGGDYVAVFAINTYTIQSEVTDGADGTGGTITAKDNTVDEEGYTVVSHGDSLTYEFTPEQGYEVKDIIVDGTATGKTDNTYTFKDVTENGHTIAVIFGKKQFTITVTKEGKGTVTPNGDAMPLLVKYGENSEPFVFSPEKGWKVAEVLLDKVPSGTPESYQFMNVQSAHELHVKFVEIQNTVTIQVNKDDEPWVGQGITLVPKNGGANITLQEKPDGTYTSDVVGGEYEIYKGGEPTGKTVKIEDTIDSPVSVDLNYYTLTLKDSTGIAKVPTGDIYLQGDPVNITGMEVAAGYQFTQWSSSKTELLENQSKEAPSFQMPAGAVTLTAEASPLSFNAIFHTEGGAFADTTDTKTVVQTYAAKMKLPEEPLRRGYTFSGWFTGANGTGERVDGNTTVTITKDTNYYAMWTELDKVTISFGSADQNMGGVSVASETQNPVIGVFSGSLALPNNGYKFVKWMDSKQNTVGTDALFVPVQTDGKYVAESYTAVFEKMKYDIGASVNGIGGSISPAGKTTVEYLDTPAYTFTPETGYRVKEVLIDGVKSDEFSQTGYTFDPVKGGHSISVTFEKIQYTINAKAGEHGVISDAGDSKVNHGDSKTYVIAAENGWKIKEVTIDGAPVGNSNTYIFKDVTASHKISVEFEKKLFTITADVVGDGKGKITPSGETQVPFEEGQGYTIQTEEGYLINQVIVDGKNVGAVENYKFEDVKTNHSIVVSFKKKVFTIEPSVPGKGGSVTADDGKNDVSYDDSKTYVITPEEGYQIKKVIIDGVVQDDIKGSYTFENVKENGHTIEVEFEKKTFTIEANGGSNGKITPDGTTTAKYGESVTYKITPDKGYKIKNVLVDGVSVGSVSTYTFSKVTENHKITVIYEKLGGTTTGSTTNPSVKTGDETNLGWLAAALISLLLVPTVWTVKRRRNKEEI